MGKVRRLRILVIKTIIWRLGKRPCSGEICPSGSHPERFRGLPSSHSLPLPEKLLTFLEFRINPWKEHSRGKVVHSQGCCKICSHFHWGLESQSSQQGFYNGERLVDTGPNRIPPSVSTLTKEIVYLVWCRVLSVSPLRVRP